MAKKTKKPPPANIINARAYHQKDMAGARKEMMVQQGLAPPIPVGAVDAAKDTLRAGLQDIANRPYLEPGTPEYSEAFTAARQKFEDEETPYSTKIGPSLRRNNITGEDIHFPALGEWQPGTEPDLPRLADPGNVQQTPMAAEPIPPPPQAVASGSQGEAYIASRVPGASDAPPAPDAGGTYDTWLGQRHQAIQMDITLDGLMRPMFDAAAADNPVVAANGQMAGDVWRTVQAITPAQIDAAKSTIRQNMPSSQGKPAKPATRNPDTVGLPGGKEYPSIGAMLQDWGATAGGVVNEIIGIKPAKGQTLDDLGPQFKTPEEALEFLTGATRPAPPPTGGPLDAAWQALQTAGKAVAVNAVDAAGEAATGVVMAVKEAIDSADMIAEQFGGDLSAIQFPEADPPDTPAGAITRNVVQFMTGFYIGGKALKLLGWAAQGAGKISRGSRFMVQGAISDAAFFDEQSGKIADLLVQVPALKNPVTEYLASDPTDTAAEGKLKNALNGVMATPLIPAFMLTLRAARAGVRMAKGTRALPKEAEGIVGMPLGAPAVTKSLLGDATEGAPLTVNPSSRGETVVSPAVRLQGKVFTGSTHSSAWAQAQDAGVHVKNPNPDEIDGFVTSTGRYVSRAEATKIADAAGQGRKLDQLESERDFLNGKAPLAKVATSAREVEASGYTPIGGGPAGGPQVFANFAAIKTPDDIQKIANEMAAAFEGSTDAARRGVVTWDQTKAAAGEMDAFDTLMARKGGEAPNAAQVYAWRSLYEGSLRKLQEVAQKATQAPLNEAPQALVELKQMEALVLAIQKEFYGARAEAGRALNAFRIPTNDTKQIESLLNQYGGLDVNIDLARKIASINDPAALAEFVEKSTFTKLKDAWQQVFYFNVLSSPKTQIRNITGNVVMLGLNMAETSFAAQMSKVLGDDAVYIGEAAAQWAGLRAGFTSALQAASRRWRTGESVDVYGKVDVPQIRQNAITADTFNMAQRGPLSRAVDLLGAVTMKTNQAMGTADEFFKVSGRSATGYQMAFAQAQRELTAGKITADQVKDRVAQIVEDFPNRLTDDQKAAVAAKAAYMVFQDEPGKFTQLLMKLRDYGSAPDAPVGAKVYNVLARMSLPFVLTPSRIASATFERTPLAPLMGRYWEAQRAGGAAAYQANAKMALGSMMMATYVDLSMNGTVTDGGPKNKAQYDLLYATGWRPWSVKVGDRYFNYQGTGPLSTIMGWGASIGEMLANSDVSDPTASEDYEKATVAALFALSEVVLDQTYLKNTADLIDVLNGGGPAAAENYFKRFATGAVVPNIVRDVETMTDPVQRYTTGYLEEIKSRIPGLSADLPPRRDPFGLEKNYQSGFGVAYDAISPFYSSTVKNMPIAAAMIKDGWALGLPQPYFTIDGQRIDITGEPQILSRFIELRGQVKPSGLTGKIRPDYLATDRYTSGELAQTWSDRLRDRYGDRNMTDTLNAIVSESPPFELRDLAERYHSYRDADDRKRLIQGIVGDYQDAAKAALFTEYPELLARAERAKTAGMELMQ